MRRAGTGGEKKEIPNESGMNKQTRARGIVAMKTNCFAYALSFMFASHLHNGCWMNAE
jgi:hypothetical protein